MSKFRTTARLALALAVPALALGLASGLRGDSPAAEREVTLCDGVSTIKVPTLSENEKPTREESQALAERMLHEWRKTQGAVRWAAWTADQAAAPQQPAAAKPAGPGQPFKYSARDQLIWKKEMEKWIAEGYKAFHSAETLGSKNGISCDMCHPDATNTHPETYPKFQAQIKKMSLLRDMINWCIENPMEGKPLPENDPRLRAVEAYILSERAGVPLEPGKH